MRQVAALAGVGLKTVSRVINGEPNVSESTTQKVNEAAAQLNYLPDLQAGNLRRGDRKTRTLGLLVGSVANPFSGAIHRAVEDLAAERGTAVFASSLDDDPSRERGIVDTFLRRRVDGLILTTAARSQAYLLPEVERGTPVAFVDREPTGVDADTVVCDNAEGASLATAHLLAHGHRRIAFLGDRTEIWTERERRRGFLEALGAAGVPTSSATTVENLYDVDVAREAVLRLLAGENAPTAIFSSQNLISIGVIRALRDLGAGNRVAMIGFDDFQLADLLEPAVTVVAQDPYRMGTIAAERIFARLDGDDSPAVRHVVRTRLIERGSGELRAHG
jgi:LacI family transcriptional regulator